MYRHNSIKLKLQKVLLLLIVSGTLNGAPPAKETVHFTAPQGWQMVDSKELSGSVKAMAVGKGAHPFPPSITLGSELYDGTLKEYLKRVKEINQAQKNPWKDLGSIRTAAGRGSLSQSERKTEWGVVKMMHLILSKNGVIYILNAAALKEEFPTFYNEFFKAFQSMYLL